jgi:hypothetical protein
MAAKSRHITSYNLLYARRPECACFLFEHTQSHCDADNRQRKAQINHPTATDARVSSQMTDEHWYAYVMISAFA